MQSDSPSGSPRTLTSWYWIAVLVVTVAVRGGILAAKRNELQKDPDGYRNLARTLRATGTLGFWHGTDPPQKERVPPTAFRPPLYPLLLSTLVRNGELSTSAVAGMHCVLGLATVVLTVGIGRRLGLGPEAWLAGLVVAVDPILLNQSTQVMTETLATFLAMLAWCHWLGWGERLSSGQAVLTGLAVGLTALCRPTFLPWGLLLIVAALFHSLRVAPEHSWRSWGRWRGSLGLAIGMAAVVIPWGARNFLELGHWKLTTTHGGYTLLLGNNPDFYRWLRESDGTTVWESTRLDRAWLRNGWLRDAEDDLWRLEDEPAEKFASATPPYPRDEFAVDALAYSLAWRYIAAEPHLFLRATRSRFVSFWRLVPTATRGEEPASQAWLRWGTGGWYLLVYVAAALGIGRLGRRLGSSPWLAGCLLSGVFTLVHLLYWSNMRMRAPLIPVLALLAAVGITDIFGRFARVRRT